MTSLEGLLTVLLRLVFLLYAEDRDLIPSRTEGEARALYDQGYGVRSLYTHLLEDAAHHPDTMDEPRRLVSSSCAFPAGAPRRSEWLDPRARGQAGSGAFLVESCRALAARLVWAWERWPEAKPKISQDEDDDLHAKRLVAQRCLYGVDKNPLAMPGVAKLSRGAWYDPAGAEDGAVHVHGNANVLRHDRGTLKLSQGPSSGTNMVEIERWKEPLPPVRAFEPPEVVPGITNSPWTGLQLYGHHNPGSVEYF